MPSLRGVTVSLISQQDLLTIPEYSVPPSEHLDTPKPSPSSFHFPSIHPSTPTTTVLVPTYPADRLWLSYAVPGPPTPAAHYFFRLLLDGRPLVAWGCGHDHQHKGKLAFAIVRDHVDNNSLIRKALCFAAEPRDGDAAGRGLEVHVHRVRARRRYHVYGAPTELDAGALDGEVGEEGPLW